MKYYSVLIFTIPEYTMTYLNTVCRRFFWLCLRVWGHYLIYFEVHVLQNLTDVELWTAVGYVHMYKVYVYTCKELPVSFWENLRQPLAWTSLGEFGTQPASASPQKFKVA